MQAADSLLFLWWQKREENPRITLWVSSRVCVCSVLNDERTKMTNFHPKINNTHSYCRRNELRWEIWLVALFGTCAIYCCCHATPFFSAVALSKTYLKFIWELTACIIITCNDQCRKVFRWRSYCTRTTHTIHGRTEQKTRNKNRTNEKNWMQKKNLELGARWMLLFFASLQHFASLNHPMQKEKPNGFFFVAIVFLFTLVLSR